MALRLLVSLTLCCLFSSATVGSDVSSLIKDLRALETQKESPKNPVRNTPKPSVKKRSERVSAKPNVNASDVQEKIEPKGIVRMKSSAVSAYEVRLKARTTVQGVLLEELSTKFPSTEVIVQLDSEDYPILNNTLLFGQYRINSTHPGRVFITFNVLEFENGKSNSVSAYAKDVTDNKPGIIADVESNTGNRIVKRVFDSVTGYLDSQNNLANHIVSEQTEEITNGYETLPVVSIPAGTSITVVFNRTTTIEKE